MFLLISDNSKIINKIIFENFSCLLPWFIKVFIEVISERIETVYNWWIFIDHKFFFFPTTNYNFRTIGTFLHKFPFWKKPCQVPEMILNVWFILYYISLYFNKNRWPFIKTLILCTTPSPTVLSIVISWKWYLNVLWG